MASTFWIAIAAIAIVSILVQGVVQIVRVSKSGGGKQGEKIRQLEDEVQDLDQELLDLRKRVEVLESIVTDQKYDLGRKIDDLASG
ncbi:MAG: hypothetical protein O3B72_06910 [Proteobacteria bacterium]|nr:hypothetical protein [Pseudomonadota bacterium]